MKLYCKYGMNTEFKLIIQQHIDRKPPTRYIWNLSIVFIYDVCMYVLCSLSISLFFSHAPAQFFQSVSYSFSLKPVILHFIVLEDFFLDEQQALNDDLYPQNVRKTYYY